MLIIFYLLIHAPCFCLFSSFGLLHHLEYVHSYCSSAVTNKRHQNILQEGCSCFARSLIHCPRRKQPQGFISNPNGLAKTLLLGENAGLTDDLGQLFLCSRIASLTAEIADNSGCVSVLLNFTYFGMLAIKGQFNLHFWPFLSYYN